MIKHGRFTDHVTSGWIRDTILQRSHAIQQGAVDVKAEVVKSPQQKKVDKTKQPENSGNVDCRLNY